MNAAQHELYFSTNEADVAAGAEAAFQVRQSAMTFDLDELAPDTTYYWRVDEIAGDGSKQAGAVWQAGRRGLEFHDPRPRWRHQGRILRQHDPLRRSCRHADRRGSQLQLARRRGGRNELARSGDSREPVLRSLDRRDRDRLHRHLYVHHEHGRRRAALGRRRAVDRPVGRSGPDRGQGQNRAGGRPGLSHPDGILRERRRSRRPTVLAEPDAGA